MHQERALDKRFQKYVVVSPSLKARDRASAGGLTPQSYANNFEFGILTVEFLRIEN